MATDLDAAEAAATAASAPAASAPAASTPAASTPTASTPTASIVVPTRDRLDYLEVALASIAPQVTSAGAELVVVDDAGASPGARAVCERLGARYLPHPAPLGLNHARNTGVTATRGELVVFVDDDVEARPGWLAALLAAAREHPEVEVFTGLVRAQLEGSPPRTCGAEQPPITALDLGAHDTFTPFAWGVNMAIRRAALERVGPFETALVNGGDEQEWQERLWVGSPTQALYVAAAALDHRRDTADSRLGALCRAAFARGRAAQRFDAWRDRQPSLGQELWTLLACCGHVVRRRCPAGLTMVAHSAGRLRERLVEGGVEEEDVKEGDVKEGDVKEGDVKEGGVEGGGVEGGVEESFARQGGPSGELTPPLFNAIGASTAFSASTQFGANTPPSRAASFPFKEKKPNTPPPHTPPHLRPHAPPHPHHAHQSPAAATEDTQGEQGTHAHAVDDFLSGESGTVGGLEVLRHTVIDARDDALQAARARALRLRRAARRSPAARRVLALCVERPQNARLADAIAAELARSRHRVELRRSPPGTAGKFENVNRLLARERLEDIDWLLVLDDDITLPHAFLDRFLFLAERFALDLAQPAHRARSHAAWRVTRRRGGAVVRETRFVEIGPATAFARRTFATLLPFPSLRMGWGLDLHWAALAAEHGWRCGVIDAVAIGHRQAPAASAYSREQALAEARAFLRERPYLRAADAQRTLTTHRRW